METRSLQDDPVLSRMQEEFPGHRIWRARRWDGRAGDWVATLLDPAAGVDLTVIRSDAEALRSALVSERQRAVPTKRAW
jgi:hypothetical protein